MTTNPLSAWFEGDEHESGFGAQCKCGTYIHANRYGWTVCDGCGREYEFEITAHERFAPTQTTADGRSACDTATGNA